MDPRRIYPAVSKVKNHHHSSYHSRAMKVHLATGRSYLVGLVPWRGRVAVFLLPAIVWLARDIFNRSLLQELSYV